MLPVVDSIAAVRAEDDGDYIPGQPPVGDANDGDGVEGGDDADAGSDDAAEQTLAKRHRHQEHADGTATAPASLHPSTNDLEGQNADDTDVRSGADVDADARLCAPARSYRVLQGNARDDCPDARLHARDGDQLGDAARSHRKHLLALHR